MVKWINKYKFILIGAVAIAAVLTAAFVGGGSLSGGESPEPPAASAAAVSTAEVTAASPQPATTTAKATQPTTKQTTSAAVRFATSGSTAPATVPSARQTNTVPAQSAASAAVQAGSSAAATRATTAAKARDDRTTAPTAAAEQVKPTKLQPQTMPTERSCTFSISCAVLLDQKDALDEAVAELVPADGYLLKPVKMTYSTGESVFDLLKRACRQNNIHMEYTDTPAYHSVYIEGIGNLYEFDCGEGSGWMYRVNGQYPNYGCSRCTVNNGDVIEWRYTCDYGKDIGGDKFKNTDQ